MKRFFLLIFVLAPCAATGEPMAALTATNELVRFDSATPGTVAATTITGLLPGDELVGIDLRPANRLVYGVAINRPAGGGANIGRIYMINPLTGAAALASTLAADPADAVAPTPFASIAGSFFGVDFNPVVDRLRVVSDEGQNLRINVATGLTQLDVPLAYAAGDANAGTQPMTVASAYANNVAGTLTTTLYGIDVALGTLVTQTPANDGRLNTIGLTSLSAFADTGFDISGATGVAYVVLDGSTLSTMNLANGDVTAIGPIGTVGSITGLTVLPVPEPTTLLLAAYALGVGVCLRQRSSSARGISKPTNSRTAP